MSRFLTTDPFADFDRFFPPRRRNLANISTRKPSFSSSPAANQQLPVNVFETDDAIGIEAWLPGFSEDDLSVTIDRGLLRIHAQREPDTQADADNDHERTYRRRELTPTGLSRSFRLDPAFDAKQISARLANGVLQLSLPKTANPKPHQIPIN